MLTLPDDQSLGSESAGSRFKSGRAGIAGLVYYAPSTFTEEKCGELKELHKLATSPSFDDGPADIRVVKGVPSHIQILHLE